MLAVRFFGVGLAMICGLPLWAGCLSKIDPREVPGTYAVRYPYGVEKLKINHDGTYEQLFGPNEQALKPINKGNWEVRTQDELQLIVNNPVIVDDGFGKKSQMKQSSGYWPLRIKQGLLGQIRLPVNEDLGFVFKKVR